MEKRTISSEFQNADSAAATDRLVRYLDFSDSLPEIRQIRVRSYGYLGLKEGDAVLDAGCGLGSDAIRMAAMVGKTGHVTGIDLSERFIAIAEEKAKGTGLPISFRVGDVRSLPFPDASFDAVRIQLTLQILKDPGQVLDEMIRVLRPGGRLLAIEPDWETYVCDPGSRDTARTFFRFCADQFPDGSTGRKLYRYFRERGLRDVSVHPEPLVMHDFTAVATLMNMEQFLAAAQEKGVLAQDEVAAWLSELKAADERGRCTFAGLIFAVAARKA
ncbi:MAG: tRNA (adenine(57)-N(1)/adenine(58)-N(1))-methyltransferase TrmI [Methanoregula sp. PtaU1.Bin051]|nr:MAG: tRNA (adenine(57)-N(1)/adenine(58)-N(1))-methyltransferase TrmI [Methanoregula sp. PtaU1.Bin051]